MISNECLGVKTSEKLFLICARLSTHGRPLQDLVPQGDPPTPLTPTAFVSDVGGAVDWAAQRGVSFCRPARVRKPFGFLSH